jgi:hypothetical protein
LVGKQFVAQVTQTRTSSRNKLEFGTIGLVQPEKHPELKPGNDGASDDTFNDLPW